MPSVHRRKRLRRLGVLGVALVVLVVVVVFGVRWGCGGDETAAGSGGTAVSGKQTQIDVGAPVTVNEAKTTVTAFTPTDKPTRPMYAIDEGVPAPPAAGQTYYQAFIHIENRGPSPFRYAPDDFDLLVDGSAIALDPVWSGPGERTLLPGASLDAIVTFRAPVTEDVKLRWRPRDGGSTILFIGTRKPEGMALAPGAGRGQES